jgi:hypothetical protein
MDFIERFFGVSPDAGTGSIEVALLVGLTMIVVYLATRRQRGRLARGRTTDR